MGLPARDRDYLQIVLSVFILLKLRMYQTLPLSFFILIQRKTGIQLQWERWIHLLLEVSVPICMPLYNKNWKWFHALRGGFRSEPVVLICRYTVILKLLTSLYADSWNHEVLFYPIRFSISSKWGVLTLICTVHMCTVRQSLQWKP